MAAFDTIRWVTLPGRVVNSQSETTDSSTFTTGETVIGTVAGDLVIGQVYIVECVVQLASSVTTDIVQASMREDNVSGTEIAREREIMSSTGTNGPVGVTLRARYTAVATGSKTFVVTGIRVSGSGNIRREAGSTFAQVFTITCTGL